MNNLRRAALLRWKRDLNEKSSKITNNKKALLMKAALCGFLAGDGSVQVRNRGTFKKYQLDFFPDDDLMLKTYCEFMEKVYNKTPSIRIRDNVYCARLSSRYVVLDLLNICKFGVYNWNFPKRLWNINGAKEAWLKAFFSAEGYVNKKVIKIQSVNLKSILGVRILLKNFKIKSNYCTYVPKNNNHSKVGMIFINEKFSRKIFFDKIGFWHERKNTLLRETLHL